ncbi:MAG: YeeE/YedE family protein [Marinilabiliales bacterium]|nr:YeeE/YedE family protein [Marinilabiliales bacterium]
MKQNKYDGTTYLNPYLGGVLLGTVLLLAFYISGRGLGASGAVKNSVAAAVNVVAPEHVEHSAYYCQFAGGDKKPMNNWLVYEVLGVLAGAFLSGLLFNRLKIKTEHSPKITERKRLLFAMGGGVIFGFGSQLARGCTSGAALSGMAVLSLGGYITMVAIFGTAFVAAWIFRKNWI